MDGYYDSYTSDQYYSSPAEYNVKRNLVSAGTYEDKFMYDQYNIPASMTIPKNPHIQDMNYQAIEHYDRPMIHDDYSRVRDKKMTSIRTMCAQPQKENMTSRISTENLTIRVPNFEIDAIALLLIFIFVVFVFAAMHYWKSISDIKEHLELIRAFMIKYK